MERDCDVSVASMVGTVGMAGEEVELDVLDEAAEDVLGTP